MLDDYEKGFSMENLDEFFGLLKRNWFRSSKR